MNSSYGAKMKKWIYVISSKVFAMLINSLNSCLWLQYIFLEVPTEFQNQLISKQNLSDSGQNLVPFWCWLFCSWPQSTPLTMSPSFQGHGVSKWQRWEWNLGCVTPTVLLFAMSQTPGNQETWTKLPLQLCKAIWWEKKYKKTQQAPLRETWKAAPPLHHALHLTVGLNNLFLSFTQIQRNCASQFLWLKILLHSLDHYSLDPLGPRLQLKPKELETHSINMHPARCPSACHLKCRTLAESPFGLVIFLNFCQTTA